MFYFYSMQRFSLEFKLVLLTPSILWFVIFNLSRYIPYPIRPPVDVTSLSFLENGILQNNSLQFWPRCVYSHINNNKRRNNIQGNETLIDFLDLLSAFVYILHFVFVWVFAIGLYAHNRKRRDCNGKPLITPWTFFWCWGWLNLTTVITQLSCPTAPPWYLEVYGTRRVTYNITGDPAGLNNADKLLNISLFDSLYGHSPIVFGSFPSLHGAWPLMITIFTPDHKFIKLLGMFYTSLVWWAALYLNHHFLVDLLGGLLYVIMAYVFGMLSLHYLVARYRNRMYGKGTFIRYGECE